MVGDIVAVVAAVSTTAVVDKAVGNNSCFTMVMTNWFWAQQKNRNYHKSNNSNSGYMITAIAVIATAAATTARVTATATAATKSTATAAAIRVMNHPEQQQASNNISNKQTVRIINDNNYCYDANYGNCRNKPAAAATLAALATVSTMAVWRSSKCYQSGQSENILEPVT